jgi:dCMP deaminase
LYTTLFPCNESAKVILQSGIRRVVYKSDKNQKEKAVFAAKKMFDLTGVRYKKYNQSCKTISLEV